MLALAVLLLIPNGVTSAATVSLSSGDVLRVVFTANPGPFPSAPDVLVFSLGSSSGSGISGDVTTLYNSGVLLGTQATSAPLSTKFFRSASSSWPSGTVIDFSSFVAGPVQGRIDFRIASGSATVETTAVVVSFGRSNTFFGGAVQSVEVIRAQGSTNYGLFIGSRDPGAWDQRTVPFDQNAQTMASAFGSRPNSKPTVLTGDLTIGANGNPISPISISQIRGALTNIRQLMLPGDSLTVYVNNHGGSFTTNALGVTAVNNTGFGDEYIDVGEGLADNTLASMLEQFFGFRVSVFLDTCHGGGFWGGSDAAENRPLGRGFNDLNQLANISLYSGAPEDKLAFFYPFSRWSFWGMALKEAFETPISWTGQGLANFLSQRTLSLAASTTVPVWYSLGLGDPVPADLSLIQAFQANSTDFDMEAPLLSSPEPVTQISDLLTAVTGVGPGRSLADKMRLVQTYYEVPNIGATCEALRSFINEVNAQAGKTVRLTDAERFIASARFTMAAIKCSR